MIDDFINDCNNISKKYNVDLIDVVLQFSITQCDYNRQMIYVHYNIIIDDVIKYFEYNKDKNNKQGVDKHDR